VIDFYDLRDLFVSEQWADLDERPKLAQAIRLLCERMPQDVYDELPSLLILAPAAWKHGQVLPVPQGVLKLVIYFAPDLEKESQAQNDYTVAHEFAHAALNHGTHEWQVQDQGRQEYLAQHQEIAAVKLVKQWGYQIPAYREHKLP
jgi:hypothetical protein